MLRTEWEGRREARVTAREGKEEEERKGREDVFVIRWCGNIQVIRVVKNS